MNDSSGISSHYRAGFASIGRAISLAKDWETKKLAWANGLRDALTHWNGILRTDAVSECWNIAEAKGLVDQFGQDEIQRVLSDEVLKAAEPAPGNGANAPHKVPARKRQDRGAQIGEAFTDDALALTFAAEFDSRLRYVAKMGMWFLW